MKKIIVTIVALLFLPAVAYLLLWPVPIKPISWDASMPPGYVGPFAVNTKLANLKMISLSKEEGPEHIVIGKDGKLYTTVASGNILRVNPDGSTLQMFVNTGGRVLGFDFDAAGNMIAADVNRGLLSIRSVPEERSQC
jgi:YD repeat-containing protein